MSEPKTDAPNQTDVKPRIGRMHLHRLDGSIGLTFEPADDVVKMSHVLDFFRSKMGDQWARLQIPSLQQIPSLLTGGTDVHGIPVQDHHWEEGHMMRNVILWDESLEELAAELTEWIDAVRVDIPQTPAA